MANDDKPKLPKRLYYRLSEAADVLGCTENDLLQMGVFGAIEIVCRTRSKAPFFLLGSYSIREDSGEKWVNSPIKKTGFLVPNVGFDFVTCPSQALFDIDMNGFSRISRTSRIFEVLSGRYIVDETPRIILEDVLEWGDNTRLEKNEIAIADSLGFRFVAEWKDSIQDTFAEKNLVTVLIEKSDLFVLSSEVDRIISGETPSTEQKNRLQDDVKQDSVNSARQQNNHLKIIKALRQELIETHKVKESNIASIVTSNNDSVPQSTVYKILRDAQNQ